MLIEILYITTKTKICILDILENKAHKKIIQNDFSHNAKCDFIFYHKHEQILIKCRYLHSTVP